MAIKIALAGNPNCGKTTMFNDLTGSNQYVGNWPGVTVEKKEGQLRGASDVIIQDLPGIYSLSPYTLEEVVSRTYLVQEKPDAILNIVDASNIERNLYLTTQLAELGIPMIVALNMIDIVRKNGDVIDLAKLSKALGCEVIETSALKGEGSKQVAEKAAELARQQLRAEHPHVFAGSVEHALAHIEDLITHHDGEEAVHHHHADGSKHEGAIVAEHLSRWYAIKLFERDEKVIEELNLPAGIMAAIEKTIQSCEREMDDDADSIIVNQRYAYIDTIISASVKKARPAGALSTSDKIDKVLTNRFLALPLFAFVMWLVYTISIGTIGDWTVTFMNDGLFGSFRETYETGFLSRLYSIPELLDMVLLGTDGTPVVADWLYGLIMDGIVGGVGAVLGFVPQMMVLFVMLGILEDCGYMSRIAFIMDRMFRKFGLSGKSFIPMLVGVGCGVPGVMASRTIESQRDRRMTIMTTTFMPCGAKMPIIALIAGALFNNSPWIATSAFFIGIAAVVVSGMILKKTKLFAGEPSPFVMELPAYHAPIPSNVLRSMWDRGMDFIKRAGTVILVSSILIWFAQSYGWEAKPVQSPETVAAEQVETVENAEPEMGPAVWGAVEDTSNSVLARVGNVVAPVFKPLGFGDWKPTVATVLGLVAKEEVVAVFGVLYDTDTEAADTMTLVEEGSDDELAAALSPLAQGFHDMSGGYGQLAAFAFMMFNLLCAPCFAAIGAIKREMNSARWTWFAIGYQCGLAYIASLITFQLGRLIMGGSFTFATGAALVLLLGILYMLFRKNRYDNDHLTRKVNVNA